MKFSLLIKKLKELKREYGVDDPEVTCVYEMYAHGDILDVTFNEKNKEIIIVVDS